MVIDMFRGAALLCALLFSTACVQNAPFRTTEFIGFCYDAKPECNDSIIERHLVFDIGFIEFTQRGNLYKREHFNRVMDFVDKQSKKENGVAVFVFAHGWKHNASSKDGNVNQFKEFLSHVAENEIVGKRKVIGIYLGWRGKSSTLPIVRETTFWARKSIAEEIGDGGATEVLSELHQILVSQYEKSDENKDVYKNTYVVIGHSFGGAMVLSAVHDILLHNIISAAKGRRSNNPVDCEQIERFADGIVILNPALEANRAVLLKEATARCQFGDTQAPLLQVLSSDGDIATRVFFPAGQIINLTSSLGPKKLTRKIGGKSITLNEHRLDTNTMGNLKQFRTAYLSRDHSMQRWRLAECREDLNGCGIKDTEDQENHFPLMKNDPIKFIKTDTAFIKNHSDVFGCHVQSFITTTILQTQSIEATGGEMPINANLIEGCNKANFDFQSCLNSQTTEFDC